MRRWNFLFVMLPLACSASGNGGFVVDPSDASTAGEDRPVAQDIRTPTDQGPPQDTSSFDTGTPALPDVAPVDRPVTDALAGDVRNIYDTGTVTDGCTPPGCTPRPTGCVARETCGNSLDDDCNGTVDDNCPCVPGTVQDCFLGPPARRAVGACRGGTQRCEGTGEFGMWGTCTGGISPAAEACNGLDDDCDGCVDNGMCCTPPIMCPGPGDPRVPDGRPFEDYPLRGGLFYTGTARSWNWRVEGGPCDTLLPRPTYTLLGVGGRDVIFRPTLSGDYRVTLEVVTATGERFTCTWIVHIAGPGLRVELCWDTSTTVDLDLYVHDPRNTGPWFNGTASPLTSSNANSCSWANCEAALRGTIGRANWGYANSPLTACQFGPHGAEWRTLGYCANPRLDIDNNLVKATGVPENINIDNPRNSERFRVMVQNFTGTAARPIVNIYCGGHLRGTLGAPPNFVPDLTGTSGATSIGAMWRAVDVTTQVDASGATTGCTVAPLHAPGMTSGHWVTRNDPSY
jgi:hypothetical protein